MILKKSGKANIDKILRDNRKLNVKLCSVRSFFTFLNIVFSDTKPSKIRKKNHRRLSQIIVGAVMKSSLRVTRFVLLLLI